MPRINRYTHVQKIEDCERKISDSCEIILYKNKISKSELARYMEVTPQAVCLQFANHRINLKTMIAVLTLANVEISDMAKIMKAV